MAMFRLPKCSTDRRESELDAIRSQKPSIKNTPKNAKETRDAKLEFHCRSHHRVGKIPLIKCAVYH